VARSISIVEYKVQQTHFYLEKIHEAGLDFFAAQCFVDAFVGAARSITFAMQAVISDVPGFAEWYEVKQNEMKNDAIFRFFNHYRTVSTHIGDTVVKGFATGKNDDGSHAMKYYFQPIADLPDVPQEDVQTVCTHHFKTLLGSVFKAMQTFKYELDDRWYFTRENFARLGKTADDADEELGFPRGWTAIEGPFDESERWKALRHSETVGCQLNVLFVAYLGKAILGPDEDTEPAIN
jgi:hypothetical protein